MRQGRNNKTKFRQFTSRLPKNLHSSTESKLPSPTWSTPREFQVSILVGTTRVPGYQLGPQRKIAKPGSDLVHDTRYAHFAEVRCSTGGTGCLSSDLLYQLTRFCIGHLTTVNLERKLRETTCLSGAPTQTRDTEKQPQNKGRHHRLKTVS